MKNLQHIKLNPQHYIYILYLCIFYMDKHQVYLIEEWKLKSNRFLVFEVFIISSYSE